MTNDRLSHNISSDTDIPAAVQGSVNKWAELLTLGQIVHGTAGLVSVIALTAGGLLPLVAALVPGGSAASVVVSWLTSIGGNALAGWLANWAHSNAHVLLGTNEPDERVILQQLAADLQANMAMDRTLADDLGKLIEQSGVLDQAISTLVHQGVDQQIVLEALQQDLRRSDLIKGRLHHVLTRHLDQMERRLTIEVRDARDQVLRAVQAKPKRLTPFITAGQFFAPLTKPHRLFNHTLPLVGRDNVLNQLRDFVHASQYSVAILPGRGGIGKSKLLYAFATEFNEHALGMALRFVSEGVPITDENVMDVPDETCLVIVDDAHRSDRNIGPLLALAQHRLQPIKLLFSCRPQGVDHLLSQLIQVGFDPREILWIDELRELDRDDVKTLARLALGDESNESYEQLAAITFDSPLVTVIGGRLIRDKAVSPNLLERDVEFRQAVLTRFEDVLLGQLRPRIDPKLARSLLSLLSAVGPLLPTNNAFVHTAAIKFGVEPQEIITALSELEAVRVSASLCKW